MELVESNKLNCQLFLEIQNDSETCVYWNPELNENAWKTDGCVRVQSQNNSLTCECDHLTAFAFMDISRDLVRFTY